jgi:hypothetical protein
MGPLDEPQDSTGAGSQNAAAHDAVCVLHHVWLDLPAETDG